MHVIDVLRGESTEKVTQRSHEQLSTFGIGRERSEREWRAIARQCIALGLLEVDHEAYGALRLTAGGRAPAESERRGAPRGRGGAEGNRPRPRFAAGGGGAFGGARDVFLRPP